MYTVGLKIRLLDINARINLLSTKSDLERADVGFYVASDRRALCAAPAAARCHVFGGSARNASAGVQPWTTLHDGH